MEIVIEQELVMVVSYLDLAVSGEVDFGDVGVVLLQDYLLFHCLDWLQDLQEFNYEIVVLVTWIVLGVVKLAS